jgi:hypothetical protein
MIRCIKHWLLFISLFVNLCVKIDPDTHKGMHSVLALKLGVTLPHLPRRWTPPQKKWNSGRENMKRQ